EIPLDTARLLIDEGFLTLSEDGPVLDETSWFDEELNTNVRAEEYVLSDKGQGVIDATADGDASDFDDEDFDDDDDDDWDDEDDLDDDDWDEDDEADDFDEDSDED